MSWWLRGRRVGLLAAAVAAETGLLALVGDVGIPVPSLVAAATVPIVAAVFVPLIVSSAFLLSYEGRDWPTERAAVRPVRLLDAGLALALCGVLLALGAAGHLAGGELALEGARNAIGYVGLGLVVAHFLGPAAGSIAPAAFVLLLAAFSSGGDAAHRLWNWPLQEAGSLQATAVAAALLAAGLAAVLAGPRPRAERGA